MARAVAHGTNPASPGKVPDSAGHHIAHLDAGNPRGPDALSGTRTFNRQGASACALSPPEAGRVLPNTPANHLGSGSLSARPAAVPGSSLPEFRALLFIAAFPVAVVMFVAAVLFIFF